MKNQYGFRKVNFLVICLMTLTVFSVRAVPNDNLKIDRYQNALVQKLTEQLRVDLADQTVEIKLNSVKNNEVSKSRIDFDGNAFAVVKTDKTELPFQFTAKFNVNEQSVEDIDYQFVEAISEFAPAAAEESLMKELMAQISQDYQTTNIVIAIDRFETAQITANKAKYEGLGEVRIGDVEWRKIKFNVVLDSQTRTATMVSYDIQK